MPIPLRGGLASIRQTVATCLSIFRMYADSDQQRLLWTLAHERWRQWRFDAANRKAHLFECARSPLDYALVGYARDCMSETEREAAIAMLFDELKCLSETWHESITQDDKFRPIVPLTRNLRPVVEATDVKTFVHCGGERLTKISKAWRTMVRQSGLAKPKLIVPYSFRYTMADALGLRGIDDPNIGMYLGHLPTGSAATTAIYKPGNPRFLQAAAAAVDDYFDELRVEIEKQLPSAPRPNTGHRTDLSANTLHRDTPGQTENVPKNVRKSMA